jgi:uncharacterized protein YprB with RNaseH-like and TPR domain
MVVMTDIKDKLQQLKREREARSRSQSIQDTWSELDKDAALTTREKLEQLIKLRPTRPPTQPAPTIIPDQEREPFQFTENQYSLDVHYGKIILSAGLKISGHILACLSQDPEFEDIDLSTALFLDLETTGLSGGTGTVPFNIGMGYFRDDKFLVGQYFLSELAAEAQMIQDLARFLEEHDFQSVVTFNGKSFDIPLLETRFILHRIPFRLAGLPHLDFLFPARSLWKHKVESCRLSFLAHEILATGREEDIPSAEVPWRYFQYLQNRDFELIEPVLYHNSEDILSLLGLVILGAAILSDDPESCEIDAMDFFGAGKVLEKIGHNEKAADYYSRALDGALSEEIGLSTRRRLASQYKRSQQWDKALPLWKEMTDSEFASSDLLYSLRELSMYFEHREKDFREAHKYAEEGYVLAMGFSEYYEKDFTHRRERLKKKMKGAKKAGREPSQRPGQESRPKPEPENRQ